MSARALRVLLAVVSGVLVAGGSLACSPPVYSTAHGNPTGNAKYWVYQGQTPTCVLAATAEIVAQARRVTASSVYPQLVSVARARGLLTWRGMTLSDARLLLAVFGVSVAYTHASLPALEQVLDRGRLPVVMVDDDELPAWHRSDPYDGTSRDSGANHAVVVTGVDTVHNLVYLNDSALQFAGREETLTVAQFLNAWDDDSYPMLAN